MNVVVILTDQQRGAGPHESEGMKQFRAHHLPHQTALAAQGIQFTQHRIVSSACVPSRASLFTGLPAETHGIFSTDGFAKQPGDEGLNWLQPNAHPTLGHRAQSMGIRTAYIGKWHLSQTALGKDTATPKSSEKRAWDAIHAAYASANMLGPYGFDDWLGPEPHGHAIENSARMRDECFVQQAQNWLKENANNGPFLLVVSLVDPHDIVFWPQWSVFKRKWLALQNIPFIGPCDSEFQSPTDHAAVLQTYERNYYNAYGPASIMRPLYQMQREAYRKFYCALMKRSDAHLGTLLQTLHETGLDQTTSVVFSSDHGELLGAHGGLHQKWYNAFDETLRVPFIVRAAPSLNQAPRVEARLTDHLDVVPTVLGLLGAVAQPPALIGRDLLKPFEGRRIQFETRDHILQGESPYAAIGRVYSALGRIWSMRYPPFEPTQTAVRAQISEDGIHLWKCIRYFDPHQPDDFALNEWAIFDLKVDPCELDNLYEKKELKSQTQRITQALMAWEH